MKKTAETSVPIHALLAERWSPRSFQDREVPDELLRSVFEAARWAPSCYNAQPWTYLVAARADDPDGHALLASCLLGGNAWAQDAPVLACSVARNDFPHNGKPNDWAAHDVGLASMSLVVQAEAHGLSVHQMAGFDEDRARSELGLPPDHRPVAFLALGFRGEPDALPDQLAERERSGRERKPLGEVLQGARWGAAYGG